jgi:hypothetical protein
LQVAVAAVHKDLTVPAVMAVPEVTPLLAAMRQEVTERLVLQQETSTVVTADRMELVEQAKLVPTAHMQVRIGRLVVLEDKSTTMPRAGVLATEEVQAGNGAMSQVRALRVVAQAVRMPIQVTSRVFRTPLRIDQDRLPFMGPEGFP